MDSFWRNIASSCILMKVTGNILLNEIKNWQLTWSSTRFKKNLVFSWVHFIYSYFVDRPALKSSIINDTFVLLTLKCMILYHLLRKRIYNLYDLQKALCCQIKKLLKIKPHHLFFWGWCALHNILMYNKYFVSISETVQPTAWARI